ncbi:tetratricopeptide repeat protein [Aureimonas leprariae]|uniref:Sel1 repeat family protein n=1 Tax=Plantimonas leprariae TaxID=2615207 RepID=A0A7V7TVT4_9HYPH|nr:tetratricopeptide repeat protein [Aureimonas leprariae]KAB0678748.1 sel1 repeat family protein [Aureimonas leprariae]
MRRLVVLLAGLLSAWPASAQKAPQDLSTQKPPEARTLPTPTAAPRDEAPADAATPARDRAYGALQRGMYLTALQLALPLAKLGDPVAQTLLGEIYGRGLGVPRSDAEAARWYGAAAASGNPDGQFRYALMLLDGSAGRTDPAAARDLMKAAADAGIPLAAYNFGQMLIEESPVAGFTEALPYFQKSAQAGVSDAQYAMAQIYAYGRGVSQPDIPKARAYLLASARGGNVTGQVEFGIWLINGKGGRKDVAAGAGWLRRAAARGNPIAMNRLAHLYKDGIGVAASKVEAGKWSVLAKRADNDDASLDDFFRKLDDDTKKAALEAANKFRPS